MPMPIRRLQPRVAELVGMALAQVWFESLASRRGVVLGRERVAASGHT